MESTETRLILTPASRSSVLPPAVTEPLRHVLGTDDAVGQAAGGGEDRGDTLAEWLGDGRPADAAARCRSPASSTVSTAGSSSTRRTLRSDAPASFATSARE